MQNLSIPSNIGDYRDNKWFKQHPDRKSGP